MALGFGFGLGLQRGQSSAAALAPAAPVLTWVSDNTVNPPQLDANFDATHVWPSGSIDASNFDRIELQVDQDPLFGSVDETDTNDLDAAELLAGTATMFPGPLATGVALYIRARHSHYVGGVAHTSAWSNVVTQTLALSVPENTVAPVISGNVQVGQTLSTTNGTWSNSPTGYTYQWKRNGTNIASATNSTYVVVEADAGIAGPITCAVTASNASGAGTPAASTSLTIDVYVVFTAHVEDPTDLTTYSGGVWNNVAIGVAAANRKIILALDCRNSGTTPTFSSGTIGGQAASAFGGASASSGNNRVEYAVADLTTGTTANLSVTWSAAATRCGTGVYAVYGAGSSTPSATNSATIATGATASAAVTCPAKGIVISVCLGVFASAQTATWTSPLLETYDASVEGGICHSGASLNSNAGGSITAEITWNNGVTNASPLAVAAWGP